MRSFLVILSAAVSAGLVVFFGFDASLAISVLHGNVLISIDVFVAFIATLALGASALALLYRHLLGSGERRELRQLGERVARLESGGAVS